MTKARKIAQNRHSKRIKQRCCAVFFHNGPSPSGKAEDFDSSIRRFKSGRPNQKPYKIQRSFAGFCGAFSFCLENDGGKVRRAARSRGRHGPTKAPQGLGNKHKRTRPPRRFLLQVRRFCHKACKMHGFVL